MRSQRLHPVHNKSQAAASKYAEALEKAKKEHWEHWLEEVDSDNIWMAHMYTGSSPTDGGAARIPTLKKQTNGQTENVNVNKEKSKLLYETFFPHPPQRPPADASMQYPDPACNFTSISDKQVLQAIQNLAPYKPHGPNGVCNIVFIKCSDILVP